MLDRRRAGAAAGHHRSSQEINHKRARALIANLSFSFLDRTN